jgi:hypothetical protein
VVIYDDDQLRIDHAVAEFQKLFTQHDGLLYEERYNLLNAFFATVPGNRSFNLRKQWALNSNYADLSLLFTVDTGSKWNPQLDREYLAVLESVHGTPYYLNLHSGDVAHALITGATGSGKSFLTSFLLQSAQKYQPLTIIFDLGATQLHASNAAEQFRSEYPIKALKFDYTYRNESPFGVSAIYHDDKFTYIKSSASEKFSIYELKDKKPDLITFQLQDGTYVIPTVVDHGYSHVLASVRCLSSR